MMERRRLSLQLTPLLDLLLIVIFAQHLEVLHSAQSAQRELDAERAEIVNSRHQMDQLLKNRQQELDAETAVRRQAMDQNLRNEYSEQLRLLLDQHRQVGDILADTLRLPGELLQQLTQLRTDGQTADAARLETASQRLGDVLRTRGTELLQFVIHYDEMQKHVSIWEIHLQDNGHALFTDGEQSRSISFETGSEFAGRLFEASKAFSAPRTLVLVLLTYADTQAGLRRQATEAMPQLIEQLRRDAASTHWFEFSLMGFRPQGPIFGSERNDP